MAAESLIAFSLASALLALSPGPDNLFVLTQSILYGNRSGILITLGLCSGLFVHTSLVALGIAALMQSHDWAFLLLKGIGAAYLLYLAWQIIRHPPMMVAGEGRRLSNLDLYLRGIIMNVTNPKVSIFFLAFLPQFASPSNGPVAPQIFLLGAIFAAISLGIFSGIALLAGHLGSWLQQQSHMPVYLSWLTALIFLLLAVHLLFNNLMP